MDDKGPSTISSRAEDLPVIKVTSHDNHDDKALSTGGRRAHIRSRSHEALSRATGKIAGRMETSQKSDGSKSMQDRLLNLLISQVMPSEPSDDSNEPVDRHSRKHVDRPNFSIGIMSNNFRRFNARIGPVFVFQNRMIRLFTWKKPAHTLSFLAAYSFVCLDPYLIVVVPLAVCLFFIMVPAFLTRHPPPPQHLPSEFYLLGGPPLAPPTKIKPAPDLSKDFFRNMRDLQNSMDDFSKLHDEVLKRLLPPTNFSNESYSSVLFIAMTFICLLLFVTAHLIPWRAIFLLAGWTLIGSKHPIVQDMLDTSSNREVLAKQTANGDTRLHAFAEADIILDPAPEEREIEIFELQHRNPYDRNAEWEPWVFTSHTYDPTSPAMIAGDRPKGTRFFEDVVAPLGWRFADKKWTLDLLSREWVEERCITSVEVEVEGERWVSDLAYEFEDDADDLTSLAESWRNGQSGSSSKKGKGIKEVEKKKAVVTWEEGHGRHKLGEWRRRRWVRLVRREEISSGAEDTVVSND